MDAARVKRTTRVLDCCFKRTRVLDGDCDCCFERTRVLDGWFERTRVLDCGRRLLEALEAFKQVNRTFHKSMLIGSALAIGRLEILGCAVAPERCTMPVLLE